MVRRFKRPRRRPSTPKPQKKLLVTANTPIWPIPDHIYRFVEQQFREPQALNVLVTGKTGAGKSTLINAVVGRQVAPTSAGGRRMTRRLGRYVAADQGLVFFDTQGLELAAEAQEKVIGEISRIGQRSQASGRFADHIHCVWYCVNAESNRIETHELEFIDTVLATLNPIHSVPVIVVLTHALDSDKVSQLRRAIEDAVATPSHFTPYAIQPVNSVPTELFAGITLPPKGVDDLVATTQEILTDEYADSFVLMTKTVMRSRTEQAAAVTEETVADIPAAMLLRSRPVARATIRQAMTELITIISAIYDFKISEARIKDLAETIDRSVDIRQISAREDSRKEAVAKLVQTFGHSYTMVMNEVFIGMFTAPAFSPEFQRRIFVAHDKTWAAARGR